MAYAVIVLPVRSSKIVPSPYPLSTFTVSILFMLLPRAAPAGQRNTLQAAVPKL
jgi:hypothetical protein